METMGARDRERPSKTASGSFVSATVCLRVCLGPVWLHLGNSYDIHLKFSALAKQLQFTKAYFLFGESCLHSSLSCAMPYCAHMPLAENRTLPRSSSASFLPPMQSYKQGRETQDISQASPASSGRAG